MECNLGFRVFLIDGSSRHGCFAQRTVIANRQINRQNELFGKENAKKKLDCPVWVPLLPLQLLPCETLVEPPRLPTLY